MGGNCGGSASFFLYSQHACFGLYIQQLWVRAYRCWIISLLEVGSRHSHLPKRGVLTINIQRWKDKFLPIFCIWQASFVLLVPKRRTGWLFYDAQEHPHPGVEAQALRMSISSNASIHKWTPTMGKLFGIHSTAKFRPGKYNLDFPWKKMAQICQIQEKKKFSDFQILMISCTRQLRI